MANCQMNNEQKTTKPKIIFLGTPEFGAIILEGLVKNNYSPILVVTALDKPVGRKQVLTPSPVKIIAEKYRITLLQSIKVSSIKYQVLSIKPDLIILAAYGQILPKEILEIPKFGCLNVHPSLLPKYRGASPIQAAILNGDKETGITIILMDEKMDHGKIVSNIKYQVSSNIIYEELSKELAELGAKLLIEIIPKWINNKIEAQSQDESKATYTKIIKKEDGKIDWSKPAEEIERQIRAFYPWPGSFFFWKKNNKILRVKILEADVLKSEDPKQFCVKCGKDYLSIKKLQLEGKKPIKINEFLRGHHDFNPLL